MEKVKKSGIVNVVKKDKKGFTLQEDTNRWYVSFEPVEIKKGDNVEFDLVVVTKEDRTYYNFSNLKVKQQSTEQQSDRINIDAGNCLRAAVDISISKGTELHDTLLMILSEFKYARESLCKKDELNIIEPKEVSEVSETEY